MGKAKRRERRKPRHRRPQYTPIHQHQQVGKELVPPLKRIEQMSLSSWRDDHAPEMLWAFLLATVLPRAEYLAIFRRVAVWSRKTFHSEEEKSGVSATPAPPGSAGAEQAVPMPHAEPAAAPTLPDGLPHNACEIDHTSIAGYADEQFKAFVEILTKHPLGYAALRPLLLLGSLPGVARWRQEIGAEATGKDWQTLADAVAHSFDHQSEKSTDIRWLKLIVKMISGKMIFPEEMRERVEELRVFPDKGDMRSVRPFIRAGEMSIRRQPPSGWIAGHWAQLMADTSCIDPSTQKDYAGLGPELLSLAQILAVRGALIDRFHKVKTPQRTDARLDSTFGLSLYALSLLEEVAAPPITQMILGRMGLRALAEVVITFSYLLEKDEATSWEAYRNYGSGVAKLAFLKMEMSVGDAPKFVEANTLEEIANEDVWQEFVSVNLGHWASKNLRELAIEGGTKEVYDNYYDWTSTYSHGQWGAVRDTNFITCHNPLHRLHRIPRLMHRLLPSVVPDAVNLVNRSIALLEQAYPEMEKLPRVVIEEPKAQNSEGLEGQHAASAQSATEAAKPEARNSD